MNADTTNLIVLTVSLGLSLVAGRWAGTRWRARRREKAELARRAAESRQVRRARERQGQGE